MWFFVYWLRVIPIIFYVMWFILVYVLSRTICFLNIFLSSKYAITPWNCKFCQLPSDINKTSITPRNCTTLINLPPPSNTFVSQHDVLQIPPWSFALMCKMSPKLFYLYFFFLSLKVTALSLNCGTLPPMLIFFYFTFIFKP